VSGWLHGVYGRHQLNCVLIATYKVVKSDIQPYPPACLDSIYVSYVRKVTTVRKRATTTTTEVKFERVQLSSVRFEGPVATTESFFENGYISINQASRLSTTVPTAKCANPFVALEWTVLEAGLYPLKPHLWRVKAQSVAKITPLLYYFVNNCSFSSTCAATLRRRTRPGRFCIVPSGQQSPRRRRRRSPPSGCCRGASPCSVICPPRPTPR
jgi:hypothetical protein